MDDSRYVTTDDEIRSRIPDDVYERLADQLNALPNGFPRTRSGVEIRLLRKIVSPEEAWLAGYLGREMESPQKIGSRVGLPADEVTEKMRRLSRRGLVSSTDQDGVRQYRLVPFVVGLYEYQLTAMDHELAHLFEQYLMCEGVAQEIFGTHPPLHRVIPARKAVKSELILPYDDARALLLQARSFGVQDCICRTEQTLAGHRKCNFPLKNCLFFNKTERNFRSAAISREEALAILDEAEQIGLVHTGINNAVNNSVLENEYICNCCGCCCGFLRAINEWGIETSIAKANYYAEIDPDKCMGCEICVERCQVGAIAMRGVTAAVDLSRCIGCGLCVTGCPDEAAHLHRKPDAELIHPPDDFATWEIERLRSRGMVE